MLNHYAIVQQLIYFGNKYSLKIICGHLTALASLCCMELHKQIFLCHDYCKQVMGNICGVCHGSISGRTEEETDGDDGEGKEAKRTGELLLTSCHMFFFFF